MLEACKSNGCVAAVACGDQCEAEVVASRLANRFALSRVLGLQDVPVDSHRWPRGDDGKSLEHEVGARGCANRVRVLTGLVPGDGQPSLLSWRDGSYRDADAAEQLATELLVAIRIAREYEGA